MTTRRSSRSSATGSLFALANLTLSIAGFLARMEGNRQRAARAAQEQYQRDEIMRLKAENLQLRNQSEYLRQGQHSNRVLEGDLKIHLLNLKIAREEYDQHNLGLHAPSFIAKNYAEPGDVRRGGSYGN